MMTREQVTDIACGFVADPFLIQSNDSYGKSVRLMTIDVLTTKTCAESEVSPEPYLTGTGHGWNANGMHHVSAHQLPDGTWIAAVDGWRAATAAEIRGA